MTTASVLRKYQDIIEGKLPPGLQAHIDAKSESKEEEVEESTEEEVEESAHFSLSQVNNTPILRKYQDILNEKLRTKDELEAARAEKAALLAAEEEAEKQAKIDGEKTDWKKGNPKGYGVGDGERTGSELRQIRAQIQSDKELDAKIEELGLGKSWYDVSNAWKSDDEEREEKLQKIQDYYLKADEAEREANRGNAGEDEVLAHRYKIDTNDSDWREQTATAHQKALQAQKGASDARIWAHRWGGENEGDEEAIKLRDTPGSAAQETARKMAAAQMAQTMATTSGFGDKADNIAGQKLDTTDTSNDFTEPTSRPDQSGFEAGATSPSSPGDPFGKKNRLPGHSPGDPFGRKNRLSVPTTVEPKKDDRPDPLPDAPWGGTVQFPNSDRYNQVDPDRIVAASNAKKSNVPASTRIQSKPQQITVPGGSDAAVDTSSPDPLPKSWTGPASRRNAPNTPKPVVDKSKFGTRNDPRKSRAYGRKDT